MRTYRVFHVISEWAVEIDDVDISTETATAFARHLVMSGRQEFVSEQGMRMLIKHNPLEKKPAPLDHIIVTWDDEACE